MSKENCCFITNERVAESAKVHWLLPYAVGEKCWIEFTSSYSEERVEENQLRNGDLIIMGNEPQSWEKYFVVREESKITAVSIDGKKEKPINSGSNGESRNSVKRIIGPDWLIDAWRGEAKRLATEKPLVNE